MRVTLPVNHQPGTGINSSLFFLDIWLKLCLLVHVFQLHFRSSFGLSELDPISYNKADFNCAFTNSQHNEFWWNPLCYRRLWEVPEDLICVDLSTSDLSGIPHAGFSLHRGSPSSFMPLSRALSGDSSLFKLQPSNHPWWTTWPVLHRPFKPQQCWISWQWTSYPEELPGRLGVQHRDISKHYSNWGECKSSSLLDKPRCVQDGDTECGET